MLIIYFAGNDNLKKPAIITTMSSSVLFISAFIVDSIEVMIFKKTSGDRFTLLSKQKLIEILDKNNIEYKKDEPRAYYLTIIRENLKEKDDE